MKHQTEEEIFRSIWRQRGLDEILIDKKWKEFTGVRTKDASRMTVKELESAGFKVNYSMTR